MNIPAEPALHQVNLLEKSRPASDILVLRFTKPAGFDFLAGQFVQFVVPHEGVEVLRSFSISSAPAQDYLEFCTKIIPGGKASDYFMVLAAGESAQITPAKGFFVAHADDNSHHIHVATGSGVAPLTAIIEDRVPKNSAPTTLLFGLRNESNIFWHDRFSSLASQHQHFNFIPLLSQPNGSWAGASGRITSHLLNHINKDARYFICGPAPMVSDVRKLLLEEGIDFKNIHLEIY